MIIVVNVLYIPALIPFGGSFVTLIAICSKPRESIVRLSGNPKSEVLVDLDALRVQSIFYFIHEVEIEMAVLQDDPSSSNTIKGESEPCFELINCKYE